MSAERLNGRSKRCPGLLVAVVLSAIALAPPTHAQSGRQKAARSAVVERDPGSRVTVDWTRGMIVAVGAASGDLRAPSSAVARLTATRLAREQARKRLMARAGLLPIVGPLARDPKTGEARGARTVAQYAADDEQVAERLRSAVEHSLDLAIDHSSDGSVVLTAGLPLEATRVAVQGTPALDRAAQAAPTGLVIDARGVMTRPIIGPELIAGDATYRGPTVYYRNVAGALRDPRVGPRVVRARANQVKNGRVVLARRKPSGLTADRLKAGARAGALIVIVIGKASE